MIINDTTGEIMLLSNFNALLGYKAKSQNIFFTLLKNYLFQMLKKKTLKSRMSG